MCVFQFQSAWQTWLSSWSTSCTNTLNLCTVTPHTQVRPHTLTHGFELRKRVSTSSLISVQIVSLDSGTEGTWWPSLWGITALLRPYLLSLNLVLSHAVLWLSPGRPCFIAPFILMNYAAAASLPVINSVPYHDFVRGAACFAATGSHVEQVIDLY